MNKKSIYPKSVEIDISPSKHLIKDKYKEGFEHAISEGQITEPYQLRKSFAEGFRAGKLFLRDKRKKSGIFDFPFKGKVNFKMK